MKEVTTRYDGSEVDVKTKQLPLCGPTAALGDTIKDGELVSQTTNMATRIVSFTMCTEMANFGMMQPAQTSINLSAANQYVQVYYRSTLRLSSLIRFTPRRRTFNSRGRL